MKSFPIRAQNLRGLDDIATADGKRIRKDILFRSGDISELTDACRAKMADLGLRAFVDLRSVSERRKRPYDWGQDEQMARWGHAAEFSDSGIRELLSHANGTPEAVRKAMMDLYRKLPVSHASSYATLFHWLSAGRLPLLFSCAAGKDRTGVGAALLLWALGVDREAIIDDYLRSNDYLEGLKAIAVSHYHWDADSAQALAVLTADKSYLEAMFSEVETRWGTIEAYLSDVLEVDAQELSRIRKVVLMSEEPADGVR